MSLEYFDSSTNVGISLETLVAGRCLPGLGASKSGPAFIVQGPPGEFYTEVLELLNREPPRPLRAVVQEGWEEPS